MNSLKSIYGRRSGKQIGTYNVVTLEVVDIQGRSAFAGDFTAALNVKRYRWSWDV